MAGFGVEIRARGSKLFHVIKRPTTIAVLVLIALVCVAYVRVCGLGFVRWDDNFNVVENPHFLEAPLASIGEFWWNWKFAYKSLWVPLTYTVWAVLAKVSALPEGQFDGDSGELLPSPFEAAWFHGLNLTLHVCATVMVFFLLRRLVGREKLWPAALGAAVFGLHPLQVESVAWVTGLKDVLAGSLSLAALLAYLKFADQPASLRAGERDAADDERRAWVRLAMGAAVSFGVLAVLMAVQLKDAISMPVFAGLVFAWAGIEIARRSRGTPWFGIATLAYGLALCAKPSAVVMPGVALVIAALLGRRSLREAAADLYPWVGLAGLLTVMTFVAQSGGRFQYEVPPLPYRIVVALDALAFYMVKLVVPLGLTPDYGRSPEWLRYEPVVWVSWMLPCAAAGAALWAWLKKGRPVWAAAFAVFGMALLPVIGLVPTAYMGVSVTADRYLYLAMFGVALAVAAAVVGVADRPWLRVASVAAVGCLMALTFRQTGFWKNTESLYARALEMNPRSWLFIYNKGTIANERGEYDRALEFYEQSVAIFPSNPNAYCNMGSEYDRRGEIEAAHAHWRKAIEWQEGFYEALHNLTFSLVRLGRFDEAIAEIDRSYNAIAYLRTRELAADIWHEEAARLFGRKQFVEAAHHFERALEISADKKPKWEQGLAHAYNNVAVELVAAGKAGEAAPYFAKSIELDPQNLSARTNLAFTLANHGFEIEALPIFERDIGMFGDDPVYVTSYGAVCAKVGRRSEARTLLERARQMNEGRSEPSSELRDRIDSELEALDAAGGKD